PRLSIEITEEQDRKLTRSLEWGERRRLFAIIVDDLLAAFDRYGADKVIGALKARELNTFDIVKLNLKEPE
ncbi:hypothetical protein KAR91_79310, partial [Candidatus Pacearchaeota archaeon]|nr:hypothetical protein [Candidatus Pacearchaeota archaeon]